MCRAYDEVHMLAFMQWVVRAWAHFIWISTISKVEGTFWIASKTLHHGKVTAGPIKNYCPNLNLIMYGSSL